MQASLLKKRTSKLKVWAVKAFREEVLYLVKELEAGRVLSSPRDEEFLAHLGAFTEMVNDPRGVELYSRECSRDEELMALLRRLHHLLREGLKS